MREQSLSIVEIGGGYCASPIHKVREIVKNYDANKFSAIFDKSLDDKKLQKTSVTAMPGKPQPHSQIVSGQDGDFLVVDLSAILAKKK
ncbi:MAG: hypothetical protein H6Q74_2605 [Firmicutes bacterium]|nr:hypothetical protein [Bacillota bacterium]